jgi:hypothetical protein
MAQPKYRSAIPIKAGAGVSLAWFGQLDKIKDASVEKIASRLNKKIDNSSKEA